MSQLFNRLVLLLTTVLSFVHGSVSESHVRTVFQYPLGTWVENIAVRPNSNLLVTTITGPDVFLLDPQRRNTSVLAYSFPKVLATVGIAELYPDVFAVITGNSTLQKVDPTSFSVWSIDMKDVTISEKGELSRTPVVSNIINFPQVGLLNGIAALPESNGSVLIADSFEGVILRLDTRTGAHEVVINNTLTNISPDPNAQPIGVNGIKIRNREVFFTNSGKNVFAKIPIHSNGTPAGNASVITGALNSTEGFDDFALCATGPAFLATAEGNSVEEVTKAGKVRIIAGSLNSTLIAQSTSAALGRGLKDKNVLYVTTAGGLGTPINGNQVVGGQVLAITLKS